MHYSTLLSMGVAALHFSTAAVALSIPKARSLQTRADESLVPFPVDEAIPFPFDEADFETLEKAFALIEEIPESAIKDGKAAVNAWAATQPAYSALVAEDAAPALEPRQSAIQIANCAGSILKAIIEFWFPPAKLLKIRKLVKALGGARAVAKMLLKAKTWKDLYNIGGAKLVELGKILSGADEIIQNCFMFLN